MAKEIKHFINIGQGKWIKEDMEYMGPVLLADVESAQQRIVDVARRIEDAGEVIIQGRGGESDIVV